MILMNCSGQPEGFGSEARDEVFGQLYATLPTASRSDTRTTREEVGRHRTLFLALCPVTVCVIPPQVRE